MNSRHAIPMIAVFADETFMQVAVGF